MREIDVGRLRVAFECQGEGPPLVLLHGWPSNHREWRRQLDDLSDEFTVVAWDAPGTGRSSDPPETWRLSDWADCLHDFIAALGLQHPHVVGLSWGGGLALELYRRHPTVARTLVLVSAYAGWAGSLPASVVQERLQLYLRNAELPSDAWAPAVVETLLSADATPEMADEITSILSEFHPGPMRTAIRAFAEADLREVLPRIDVPTLLVYGEKDVRAPEAVWEALHAGIPRSELVVLPGVGHMVDIEAAPRLEREIRDFLRRIPR